MPSRGELGEQIDDLRAQLAHSERQRDALASELEQAQTDVETSERTVRHLREQLDDDRPTLELGELVAPPHLARVDDAIERLARYLANAQDDDDLWLHTEQSEARLAVASTAILQLANARDKLTPRPLPALGR